MLMSFMLFFFMIIFILIGVAFLTLLERKSLGYIQLRKGPNKIGMVGIFQPFCDAIKLFTKEYCVPINSNYFIYYISPMMFLFLSLLIWLSFPFLLKFFSFNLSLLFMLSSMSLGVYPLILAGWSSNSNYSLLGSLRAIAQTISYEVSLILVLLSFIFLVLSFNMVNFYMFQKYMIFFFISFPLSMVLFIIILAETNRSPFDFAEGESELVSGFNVEYSGGGFALIFLAEYSSILFMSSMFVFLLMTKSVFSLMFFIKIGVLSFLFIWVRGAYPRFRYDKLMNLSWKIYLSISLNYLFFFIGVVLYLN